MRTISDISRKKEMEIRLRYEYGEDLKDLATEYKLPLATLKSKQKKSKRKGDPWIKGFRSKQGYEYFVEDEVERKKLILKKINDEMTVHIDHTVDIIKTLEKREKIAMADDDLIVILKPLEESINKRIDSIAKIAELKRDIAGVYTPEKQIAIDKLQTEVELKRKELEEKEIDLQIKKETMKLYG